MTCSLPDPSLLIFDPEIERTISRIRQARHRLVLSEGRSEMSLEKETSPRSTDLVVSHAGNMAAARRVTIQEAGAPDFTMQPFQAHHLAVATDFEIKAALLNLMPKFHGLPAQEPIKHLRDFQAACSTVRRDGADETSILLKAFPFIPEGKAREWYYTQPAATVSDWDTLRREFLEKFFPAEVADKLRKDMSMIVQDESETLYEYLERFNNLLEACPHHMIDKIVLLGYVTQGMGPQDKTTLESASNGSMKKYKTTDEAWQLISDLAESTRNHR